MSKLNLRAFFWVAILITSIKMLQLLVLYPQGSWDAWSIWNRSALFLYHNSPLQFSTELPHTDYPLLLPFIIATGWRIIGSTTPLVPAVIAVAFTVGLLVLFFSVLSYLTNRDKAMLLLTVLLLPPPFIMNGGAQTADIPLAFFILLTNVCLLMFERGGKRQIMWGLASGIAAGLALHTKNEGILFVLVMLVYILLTAPKNSLKQCAIFCLGLSPFVIGLLYFKFSFAPPNDIIAGATDIPLWTKLLDINRYAAILFYLARSTAFQIFFSILIVLLMLHETGNYFVPHKLFILSGLILAGYLLIYLITPHDIWWHLETSFERLILHIWAIWLLALGLSIKTRADLP